MTVTVHDLAVYRHEVRGDDISTDVFNGQFYLDVDLRLVGGCGHCGAQIAAHNAYPSKRHYWLCGDCITGHGWDDVAEANHDIFEEE